MKALVFFVRHRSVDLVGMTAASALRERMGMGDRLLVLRRDDVFALEAAELGSAEPWLRGFTATTHWFNPNKHRFALYVARAGAIAAATSGSAWPSPWIESLLHSDRPDLSSGPQHGLSSWQAIDPVPRSHVHAIVSWDREMGLGGLPAAGQWPVVRDVRVLRAQLWSAQVRADSVAAARELVEEFTVTRSRQHGLLVHPHIEGWCSLS